MKSNSMLHRSSRRLVSTVLPSALVRLISAKYSTAQSFRGGLNFHCLVGKASESKASVKVLNKIPFLTSCQSLFHGKPCLTV